MTWVTDERAVEAGVVRGESESDNAFANRVANILRSRGQIIEAHEALTGKLYNDPDNEIGMAGITGAVAKALQGVRYGGDEIGTDIAAGFVARDTREDSDALLGLMMMLISG